MNNKIPDIDIDAMVAAGREHEQKLRAKGPEPSSACIWLPALQRAGGLPIPRTEMIEFNPESLNPTLDGNPLVGFPMAELEAACNRIGYPVFLRTDLASAKHDGPAAYKVEACTAIPRCLYLTFEDNALKDISWGLRAVMVREFLHLSAAFCAFRGLPIAREWRIFADQDRVLCEHFYWPEKAFENDYGSPLGWRTQLAKLSTTPEEMPKLRDMALRAARAVGEHGWSVDFAQDVQGKWWLIDMARAEQSWHPEH